MCVYVCVFFNTMPGRTQQKGEQGQMHEHFVEEEEYIFNMHI